MADAGTNVELGPIGDKVIFENDAIRVWSFSVPPGGIEPACIVTTCPI